MRPLLLIALLASLFSPLSLWAAAELSFETTRYVSAQNRPLLEPALQLAVKEARVLPPARNNPFTSRVKRRVHLVLTTSEDPTAQEVFGFSAQSAATFDSDAFTFSAEIGDGAELVTFVFILADRIAWDPETGRQRPDAYLRTLTAVAHELYGNVPIQLKLKLGSPPPPATLEERQKEEAAAFKAGIAFLERYQASDQRAERNAEFLAAALEREKAALATWEKPDCPTTLKRTQKKVPTSF